MHAYFSGQQPWILWSAWSPPPWFPSTPGTFKAKKNILYIQTPVTPLGCPQNWHFGSAEYGILCGSDFNSAIHCKIPRNSGQFFVCLYSGAPYLPYLFLILGRHSGRLRKIDNLLMAEGRGRGWARSRIIRPQESLVLYRSLNTLWCAGPYMVGKRSWRPWWRIGTPSSINNSILSGVQAHIWSGRDPWNPLVYRDAILYK